MKLYSDNLEDLGAKNEQLLIDAGLVSDQQVVIPNYDIPDFKPTVVTLFPTSRCNLRCIYCYADAGELELKDLDFNIAQNSIDFIVENAIEKADVILKEGMNLKKNEMPAGQGDIQDD